MIIKLLAGPQGQQAISQCKDNQARQQVLEYLNYNPCPSQWVLIMEDLHTLRTVIRLEVKKTKLNFFMLSSIPETQKERVFQELNYFAWQHKLSVSEARL